MKLLANTFLLLSIQLILISCSKESESFIGKWKHVKNPNAKIEIISNGENFLVIANGKENPATYNKGNLEIRTNQIGFEILQISYEEKDDKLLVNDVSGIQEYVRIDSVTENIEAGEPAFTPTEQLKIKNDWVFSLWRDIGSFYNHRNQICLELLILSDKTSPDLDSLIAIANDSSEYHYYDEIILNESVFTSYLALQSKISAEFSKILMTIDPYNNKSIREAISRLEHTENQIAKIKIKYNTAVKEYNLLLEKEDLKFITENSRYAKKFLTDIVSAPEVIPIVEY